MMLISETYRKLNADKHRINEAYGSRGNEWAELIVRMCQTLETSDVLDYGCGKANLQSVMPFAINNYDPAIPKYAADPKPADILVSTDVLEHIEPECIDDVLSHMASLCKKGYFFTVATRPSIKRLSDGGLTHRLIESPSWWTEKLLQHFMILNLDVRIDSGMLVVTGMPKANEAQLMKAWADTVDKMREEIAAKEQAA